MSHSFSSFAVECPNALRKCTFFRRAEKGQDALTNSRFPPLVSITSNYFFLYLAVLSGRFSFASKLCSALIWAASRGQTTSQAAPGVSSREMGQTQGCKLAPTCKPLQYRSWSLAWGGSEGGLWTVSGGFYGVLEQEPVWFGMIEVDGAAMLLLG